MKRKNGINGQQKIRFPQLQKIKISYIIATLQIGGAEKQLLYLTKNLNKERFIPLVIVLRKNGPLKKEFLKNNIQVIEIGKRFKIDILFLLKLIKILKKENPQIVHTFMFTSNTWGRISAFFAKVPIIFASERCVDLWKKWYHKLIDRLLLIFTDKLIGNSNSVKNFYKKIENISDNKIEVIYNGVDIENIEKIEISQDEKKLELKLEKSKFIVGTAGRFTEQKGFIYLLKAIPEVLKIFPDCYFIFVGDGPLRKNFEEIAEKLKIKNNVIFTGYREDVLEILYICDIIVIPSLFEGMPNIILESMALKKPVIATDIPEIKELIIDRENGILVPVRNSKKISEKIIYLLTNPDISQNIGIKGYEFVKEKFTIEKMVRNYEELYLKSLNL
ncbi:MAG: glycosyltransferase [Candidatus Omnitrophica bacterium]|nr:glycosyltransferase [Candidatus Omnitrophota bacterium]